MGRCFLKKYCIPVFEYSRYFMPKFCWIFYDYVFPSHWCSGDTRKPRSLYLHTVQRSWDSGFVSCYGSACPRATYVRYSTKTYIPAQDWRRHPNDMRGSRNSQSSRHLEKGMMAIFVWKIKKTNPSYFSFPNCMHRWTGDLCLATVPGRNLAYWRWANSVGRILATTNVTSLTKWLHWSPLLIWSSKALRLMPLTILPPSQVNSRLASSGFRAIVVDLITRKTTSFGNKVLLLLTRSYLFNVELQWYRTSHFYKQIKFHYKQVPSRGSNTVDSCRRRSSRQYKDGNSQSPAGNVLWVPGHWKECFRRWNVQQYCQGTHQRYT